MNHPAPTVDIEQPPGVAPEPAARLDPARTDDETRTDETGTDETGTDETGTDETGSDTAENHPSRTDLDRIGAALAAITERLDRDTERAAHRERVIDRQHADIERLREAERSGLLRPVVTDLCRLRNDLLRQSDELARRAADGAAHLPLTQVTALLASFADVVESALERCGVAVMPAEPGAAFEPGRQHAVRTVEVAEPALDRTVADVLAPGYQEIDGGRTVLPARVALHRVPLARGAGG